MTTNASGAVRCLALMEFGATSWECTPLTLTPQPPAFFPVSSIQCFQCIGVCLAVISPLPASKSSPAHCGLNTHPLIHNHKKKKKEKAQTAFSFYSHSALNHVPSSVCLLLLHACGCHPNSIALSRWDARPPSLDLAGTTKLLFLKWGIRHL